MRCSTEVLVNCTRTHITFCQRSQSILLKTIIYLNSSSWIITEFLWVCTSELGQQVIMQNCLESHANALLKCPCEEGYTLSGVISCNPLFVS